MLEIQSLLPETLRNALYFIGILWFFHISLRLLWRIICVLQPLRRDLTKRYGKGSWVIITGATEGIGREFARQLGGKGFNLILISRTKSKLLATAEELEKLHPGVKTLTFQADFEQGWDPELYEKIFSSIKDLDVSILINNVGWDYIGGFLDETEDFYRKLVIINQLAQVVFTRKVLPQMINRSKKSAIISMSSIASAKPLPFFSVYSATKAFNRFFMSALEQEYPEIEFLTVMPGYVSTQMNHFEEPKGDVLTVETAVKHYLNDLGVKSQTFGHWKHSVQGYFYFWVNDALYYFLYDNFIAKSMVARRKQALEKEKKK